MITMLDALDGLYKWKPAAMDAGKNIGKHGIQLNIAEGIEAISKYYYYLGACNAFVISEVLRNPREDFCHKVAVNEWIERPDHEL